jgi:hypothetical protein
MRTEGKRIGTFCKAWLMPETSLQTIRAQLNLLLG